MARLVRAGDVARFVLHPDRRARVEGTGQRRDGCERRHDEAVPIHLGHVVVEIADEIDVRLVAHAVG